MNPDTGQVSTHLLVSWSAKVDWLKGQAGRQRRLEFSAYKSGIEGQVYTHVLFTELP